MNNQSDLTLIASCSAIPTQKRLEEYQSICGQLILICDKNADPSGIGVQVIHRQQNAGNVAAVNKAITLAKGTHILWIQEEEKISAIPDLKENTFYTARIIKESSKTPVHNWQIRLFPNPSTSFFFDGFEIPDIYAAANRQSWIQSDHSLTIHREETLFTIEAINNEATNGSAYPLHNFWQGIVALEKKEFGLAIRCFNRALKEPAIAPWNKLAAINGLSNALIEIHKLPQAKKMAEKSLQQCSTQRAPYLTLYEYHNLSGNREEAYLALKKYTEIANCDTEANWDVFLPKADTAFLMAQISLHLGRHKNAFAHYEAFFEHNKGRVSDSILEKLLIYSIELSNREKAIFYFNTLFEDKLPDSLDEGQTKRMREALCLFADKGWHHFVSSIYRRLVKNQPDNEVLRNSLIRTLIKNDEIQKAQALL